MTTGEPWTRANYEHIHPEHIDMKHMDPMYRDAHGALDPVRCLRSHHRETVDPVTRGCTAHVVVQAFPAHLRCELVLPVPNGHT